MFCSATTRQWSHTGQKASDQALGTRRRCGGASQRGTGNVHVYYRRQGYVLTGKVLYYRGLEASTCNILQNRSLCVTRGGGGVSII